MQDVRWPLARRVRGFVVRHVQVVRRLLALYLYGWLVLSATGAALASSFPLTVTDALGRQVSIQTPPRRIVSLAPSITEQLFAIGAGDHVVGVTTYDNYPPRVQTLPRVGGYVGKSISVEKILSLQPDLVLSRGEIQRSVIEALEHQGVTDVVLEPKNFDEVYATLRLLGRLTKRMQQTSRVVTAMRTRVARIRKRVATIPQERRVTVFYMAYDEPLLTAGASTFIGQMIAMAGGMNIFADLSERYPQVSTEEVLRRNPAVILGPARHGASRPLAHIMRRPGWRHLTAVKTRRIYLLDDDLVSRPGPRLAEALEAVARALYPEIFRK